MLRLRKSARRSLLALCALGVALQASAAAAADPELGLEVSPMLGSTAPDEGAWRSLLVRLENRSGHALEGTLQVESRMNPGKRAADLTTRIPFALAPHAKATLEAPSHGFAGNAAQLLVSARSLDGKVLSEATLPNARPADALVLDLASPSRVAGVLRGMQFGSTRSTPYTRNPRSAVIGVTSAAVDPSSGDAVLPELPASYAAATLVLASGREFSRLTDAERAALFEWILSGGALALSFDRPEDLNHPTLQNLLGGAPRRGDPPAQLGESTTFWLPSEDPDTGGTVPTPGGRALRLAPRSELARALVAYAGGNLRPSPWGASSSYGLGEVHLLAFDTRDSAVLGDPWTRHKLADLVRHAFDRKPQVVLRSGGSAPGTFNLDGVRRELDPNQATRWTIVVSALILLLYAVLAGPVNFFLAARQGKPLRALWQLPLWSAGTLAIIAGLGILGKGLTGRARHLTIVEAGAGMTHASALRFRGFYAASSRELRVFASRRQHVLDLTPDAHDDVARTLLIDRDGPRLEKLRTKPWQTVLVREDGFIDLSGGVSVLAQGNDFLVRNRTAADLLGVILKLPGGDARYFRRILDGQSVRASAGTPLAPFGAPSAPGVATIPLEAAGFARTLDADFPGLGRAWSLLEPALGFETEWWPPDVPVLIAALDGGEGKQTDSGLRVDYDRLLLRVVGTGGVP